MYNLSLHKRVTKFIKILSPKHAGQIKTYIQSLLEDPRPHDSETLKEHESCRRGDCGEYRIIYQVYEQERVINILLVGKRNGGEIYKQMKRTL